MVGIIIAVVVVLLVLLVASTYNACVRLKNQGEEAYAQIDAHLKQRYDLIPNLVETVKGYAKHETDAINQVSEARAKMMSARSVASTAEADRGFMGALSRLMAISEAYPELKANENFKQLSAELSDTEDKIQAARRFYNAGVKEMNTKVTLFPTNLINKLVGHFKKREYYEVDEAEKAIIKDAPKVKF